MKDWALVPGSQEALVVVFWLGLLAVLIGVIGYAAYADHSARRAGQVLVPVKGGRGRRTSFVRMDRDELAEQKLAALVAKQQEDRAARKQDQEIPTPGRVFAKALRRRLR